MVVVIIVVGMVVIGLAGVIILMALPITTTIVFSGQGTQWVMAFHAHAMGMRISRSWPVPTPKRKIRPTTGIDPKRLREGIHVFNVYRHFISVLWAQTQVTQFSCVGSLGLEEASTTAIMTGLVNNLVGLWVSLHIAPNSSSRPVFGIYPVWNRVHVEGELTATVTFRVGYLLQTLVGAAVRTLYLIFRR